MPCRVRAVVVAELCLLVTFGSRAKGLYGPDAPEMVRWRGRCLGSACVRRGLLTPFGTVERETDKNRWTTSIYTTFLTKGV